jgi:hypothetical protein
VHHKPSSTIIQANPMMGSCCDDFVCPSLYVRVILLIGRVIANRIDAYYIFVGDVRAWAAHIFS